MFDPSILYTIPILLIIICFLVAAHEYGHYLFARIFKMGIEEFAIGFGKRPLKILGRKKVGIKLTPAEVQAIHASSQTQAVADAFGAVQPVAAMGGGGTAVAPATSTVTLAKPEAGYAWEGGADQSIDRADAELVGDTLIEETVYTIRPWPLGGFVRIKGMMPHEDGSEVLIPGGFYSRPPWQRLIVLFAGPLFSVLAGVLIIIPLGLRAPTDRPILGGVAHGKPAELAGLRPGDRIQSIDGEPVASWYAMVDKVRVSAGKKLIFQYERGGQLRSAEVTPEADSKPSDVLDRNQEPTGKQAIQARIGANAETEFDISRLGIATKHALTVPYIGICGLLGIVAQPSTFSDNVGGPLTMFEATREATKDGIAQTVWIMALISISVGIFNLLPIFPLDGGQMLVALAEMFRKGRRLSYDVQNRIGTVGLAMVLLLVVSVMTVDVKRYAFPPPPTKATKTDSAK